MHRAREPAGKIVKHATVAEASLVLRVARAGDRLVPVAVGAAASEVAAACAQLAKEGETAALYAVTLDISLPPCSNAVRALDPDKWLAGHASGRGTRLVHNAWEVER